MSAPDDPLRHAVDVASDAARAFEVFTDLGAWWDPASTPAPQTFGGIEVTPGVGGEVVLLLDGAQRPLGRVTAWEPGACYAQTYPPPLVGSRGRAAPP